MFNMYIKTTAGIMKWLFFIALNLVGPFVRGIGVFLAVGGGAAFLFMLWMGLGRTGFDAGVKDLSVLHAMFIGLGLALVGMAMIIYYQITVDRMLINRLYPDEEQDDGVSRLMWLRNWFGVLVMFVGFSFAAHYRYPSLFAFYWPVIGFVWWLVVGVILGMCRLFHCQGANAMSVIMELVSRVWSRLASKSTLRNEEMRAEAKVFVDTNKVVPFRKKG